MLIVRHDAMRTPMLSWGYFGDVETGECHLFPGGVTPEFGAY